MSDKELVEIYKKTIFLKRKLLCPDLDFGDMKHIKFELSQYKDILKRNGISID